MESPGLDIDNLVKFYFNYVILDESQVIKNPSSNIAKAGNAIAKSVPGSR